MVVFSVHGILPVNNANYLQSSKLPLSTWPRYLSKKETKPFAKDIKKDIKAVPTKNTPAPAKAANCCWSLSSLNS